MNEEVCSTAWFSDAVVGSGRFSQHRPTTTTRLGLSRTQRARPWRRLWRRSTGEETAATLAVGGLSQERPATDDLELLGA